MTRHAQALAGSVNSPKDGRTVKFVILRETDPRERTSFIRLVVNGVSVVGRMLHGRWDALTIALVREILMHGNSISEVLGDSDDG